jgi:hypothetical protein
LGVGRLKLKLKRKLKMRRFAKILLLLLMALCPAQIISAQGISGVAEKVKSSVKAKAGCWKLNRESRREIAEFTEDEQEWECRKEYVRVVIYQMDSDTSASKLFRDQRDQITQSPGRVVDEYQFGDESRVLSSFQYSTSSYIFFRRGNLMVRIDANTDRNGTSTSTLKNAVLFAQLLEENLTPPDNSSKHSSNIFFHQHVLPLLILNIRSGNPGISLLGYLHGVLCG